MMYRVSHHPLVPVTSTRTEGSGACERAVRLLSDMTRKQLEYHLLAIARASGRVRFDLSLVRAATPIVDEDWLL